MKEKNMANTEQYRAVLDDLMKQRSQLQFRIGEIDTAVMALRRFMPEEAAVSMKANQQSLPVVMEGKYSGMSNRWAILWFLAEEAVEPIGTGQIAEALQAGGMVTNGKNYASNVSAVLSDMNRIKGEVEATPNGWVISEKGREAWIHIKAARERKLSANSLPVSIDLPHQSLQ